MKKSKRVIGSDLAKVDAHVIQPEEYDEAPELTDEWFDRADFYIGGKLVKRGRPPKADPKVATSIRLDREVLNSFRARGAGWQSLMNKVLKSWAKRHPVA